MATSKREMRARRRAKRLAQAPKRGDVEERVGEPVPDEAELPDEVEATRPPGDGWQWTGGSWHRDLKPGQLEREIGLRDPWYALMRSCGLR